MTKAADGPVDEALFPANVGVVTASHKIFWLSAINGNEQRGGREHHAGPVYRGSPLAAERAKR